MICDSSHVIFGMNIFCSPMLSANTIEIKILKELNLEMNVYDGNVRQ